MSDSPGSIVLLTRLSRLIYKRATDDVLGMKLKAYMTLSNLREGRRSQQDLCIAMHLDPNNCVLLLNELEGAVLGSLSAQEREVLRELLARAFASETAAQPV